MPGAYRRRIVPVRRGRRHPRPPPQLDLDRGRFRLLVVEEAEFPFTPMASSVYPRARGDGHRWPALGLKPASPGRTAAGSRTCQG